jgi:serine/threonine-protein kinase
MSDNGEAALSNGTMIKDRYRVERLLGAGGMGAVYAARDTILDKRVALKILHKEIADDENMTARFIQEARAASAFKHRHVVESLDFGTHEAAPFLVMEFLEGEAFADILQREQKISPERAVSLLEPIARALARAHQAGIIHRDVKPDNVFIAKGDNEGEFVPKLVDFGIAKRTTEGELRLTKTSVAMGTPFYMPPEQAMGAKDVTPAADQYAFAAMLFEAVSAKFPHDGESYNALIINKVTKEPLSLIDACPGIDATFSAVVMKALAREPEGRYPSMTDLRDALVASVGGHVERPSITGSAAVVADPPAISPNRDASTSKALPSASAAVERGKATIPSVTGDMSASGAKAAIPADSVAGVERPSQLASSPPAKKSNAPLIGGALVALALLGGGGYALSQRGAANAASTGAATGSTGANSTPTPTPTVARRTLRIRVAPATATIQADGRELGRGAATFEATPGTEVELRFAAAGHATRTERVRLDSDQSIERVLEVTPPPAAAAEGADAGATTAARGTNGGRTTGRARSGSGGLQLGRTGVRLDLNFLRPH